MGETQKVLLTFAFIVSGLVACVMWFNSVPTEVTVGMWAWRIGLSFVSIVSLFTVLWALRRKDKAPDFIRQLYGPPFERAGLCFCVEPMVIEGVFGFRVWYQSRYANRCRARIVLCPKGASFTEKSGAKNLHIGLEVDPGGFGYVVVPFGVPQGVQGKKRSLHVAASVDYPDGKGDMVRFTDGMNVGTISGSVEAAMFIGAIAAGSLLLQSPALVEVGLPTGVSPEVPAGIEPRQVALWKMGDPPYTDTIDALGSEII